MKKYTQKELTEFLAESNAIESVYSAQALREAQDAWDFVIQHKKITPEIILKTHGIYMARLDPGVAGKLRDYPVWIGGRCVPYISHQLLMSDLENICEFINMSIKFKGGMTKKEKEEVCKKAHIRIEHWHGFGDGNGRLRIIYNWHRLQMGLPLHVIHEGDEQFEYYKWFK